MGGETTVQTRATTPAARPRGYFVVALVVIGVLVLAGWGFVAKRNADARQENVDRLACAMRSDANGGGWVYIDGACQYLGR